MDSIQITTGIKRISVNDDPDRVISFNPTDVTFAEKFYGLIIEFENKQTELTARAKAIDNNQSVDENGLPRNLSDKLTFLHEVCVYMRETIDGLFGSGASQAAFGDALSLDMIAQFLQGITPFFQAARADKLKKYTAKTGRVMK